MAQLHEAEFRKEISSSPKNLYYIFGDEKYLVRKYTKLLIDKTAGKKPSEFDFHRFDNNISLKTVAELSDQMPLFGEKNVVVIYDFNINSLSDSEFKDLKNICADIPETTVLVFSQTTITYGNKKSKTVGQEKKFRSLAEKYGTVLELNKKDAAALEKQLIAWAEKLGCTLSAKNASKIVSRCGTDMTLLKNEMDKLCSCCLSADITEADINSLISPNIEAKIYSLSTAIVKYDLSSAFSQLNALFLNNEKPEMIFAVLSSAFVDMYRVRAAEECGFTLANVAEDFSYQGRDFILRNARANSKNFSTAALRQIIDILSVADIKLKSTRADSRTLIETLVARLIVIAHKENIH